MSIGDLVLLWRNRAREEQARAKGANPVQCAKAFARASIYRLVAEELEAAIEDEENG